MTAKDSFRLSPNDGLPARDPLSLVTICLGRETAAALQVFVDSTSLVHLQGHLEDYRANHHGTMLEWLGDPLPDICLLDFDKDRQKAALMAERIHSDAPGTAIFAISSQSQPDFIIQAMRSGCSEYLLKPLDPEPLLHAVARVSGRRSEKKETRSAQVLAFLGAKGGCGVTTLVTQLGAILASSRSKKTIILDLHPEFGDAALYLGLTKFRYHLFELLQNTDRLDPEFLHSFVMHHSSGLDLIPGPQGETAGDFVAGAISQTLDFLSPRYDIILVDMPRDLNDHTLEMARHCDHLHLVTVAEVSALRNVIQQTEYFTRRDVPANAIRVVLNRHQKRSSITDAEIEKAIRRDIFWKVPNQYMHVMKTIHSGDPIRQISSSDVGRNLQDWSEQIDKKPGSEEKKKESQGILGLFNR
jgi:pilus assembly protein CpaE